MAGREDPFKPPACATYSKEKVNRAGKLLAAWYETPLDEDGEVDWEGWDVGAVIEAYEVVTWWRELHARPLSNVAAGLRYHLKEEGAVIDGRVDVTQRLKRRVTMINKLGWEPGMSLARMEDIGGVRARLPDILERGLEYQLRLTRVEPCSRGDVLGELLLVDDRHLVSFGEVLAKGWRDGDGTQRFGRSRSDSGRVLVTATWELIPGSPDGERVPA